MDDECEMWGKWLRPLVPRMQQGDHNGAKIRAFFLRFFGWSTLRRPIILCLPILTSEYAILSLNVCNGSFPQLIYSCVLGLLIHGFYKICVVENISEIYPAVPLCSHSPPPVLPSLLCSALTLHSLSLLLPCSFAWFPSRFINLKFIILDANL